MNLPGGTWKGPQIPARLLRPFYRLDVQKTFDQAAGGVYKTAGKSEISLRGTLLPLNNEDLQRLPEGTNTVNTQKLYTNGEELQVGQRVRDSLDDKVYTVITELIHNPIHGLKRYVVSKKGVAANR